MSRLTSHESLTTQLTTTTTTQCHEHHRVKQTNATTAAGLPRTDGKQMHVPPDVHVCGPYGVGGLTPKFRVVHQAWLSAFGEERGKGWSWRQETTMP